MGGVTYPSEARHVPPPGGNIVRGSGSVTHLFSEAWRIEVGVAHL